MASGISEKRGIEYVGLDLSRSEKKQKWEEDLDNPVRKEETDEIDYIEGLVIFEMNRQMNSYDVDYFETENEMDAYEIDYDLEGTAERQKTYEMDDYETENDLEGVAERQKTYEMDDYEFDESCEDEEMFDDDEMDAMRSAQKIYEMEKQLFLRSINREREEASHEMTDVEGAINRESEEMTGDEAKMFETKGWYLDSDGVILMPSQDWYYYLRLNDADYGKAVYVTNTYEGDLKYGKFFKALSGAIHKGMSLQQIKEAGTVLTVEQFPMLQPLSVHAACFDNFLAFEREERMEERIRLLSKLWTEAVSEKRDFTEVMNELYADIGSCNKEIESAITQFFRRDRSRLVIVFWFDEFCQYVASHNANQTREDIGETAKVFCWDREISVDIFNDPERITYDTYVKEKLRVASTLGRNTP